MNREHYQQLTRALIERVAERPEVLGLVALGSMSGVGGVPDEWSDHDFFLIVQDGFEEIYRQKIDWLPDESEILFALRETEHGLKVLYRNTHLLEYAVFTLEQLQLARINRYRVLFTRIELESNLAQLAQRSAPRSDDSDSHLHRSVGMLLCRLLIGVGRYYRGERASAHLFVKSHALHQVIDLVRLTGSPESDSRPDNLDMSRRFEVAFPRLGREIEQALLLPVPECAAQLLALVRPLLPARLAAAHSEAFAAVAHRVSSSR